MVQQRVCCHQRNPADREGSAGGSRAHRVDGLTNADSSVPFAAQIQSEVAVIAHTPVHGRQRTTAPLACEPVSSQAAYNAAEAALATGEKQAEIAQNQALSTAPEKGPPNSNSSLSS